MTNSKLLETLNDRAEQLCLQAETLASELDIVVTHFKNGSKVLDFGHNRLGTNGAGILLAKICMADLAEIKIAKGWLADLNMVEVETEHPLQACIASQYAGWPFTTENYFAICSGPARIARGQEPILVEHNLLHKPDQLVGIFESDKMPDQETIDSFAEDCETSDPTVTVCVARTSSLPGTIQVVARSIETAMHKLHELDVDLRCVVRGQGNAVIPPLATDDYQALGWTNDAILYGSEVKLSIKGYDGDMSALAQQVPSRSSDDFGEPFLTIFDRYRRDFYAVDRMLFSPAKITLVDDDSGEEFSAGEVRPDILRKTFGIGD